MKKAFTLIELVFVIVIIGILSTQISPSFNSNGLQQAANQIISHIRYTQHLALMDNKFDPTNPNWYKTRWQIHFTAPLGKLDYTIYQDLSASGSPSTVLGNNEIAKNPLNPTKLLTSLSGGSKVNTKEMAIGEEYGIASVSFSNQCSTYHSKMISFDYLGRPLYGKPKSLASMYRANNGSTGVRLIKPGCTITLTDNDNKTIIIAIEPETGYAHII